MGKPDDDDVMSFDNPEEDEGAYVHAPATLEAEPLRFAELKGVAQDILQFLFDPIKENRVPLLQFPELPLDLRRDDELPGCVIARRLTIHEGSSPQSPS